MSNTFSYKWTSFAGEIDSPCFIDWLKGLYDLSAEEIATGANQLPMMELDKDGKCWPPSLPEFRAMCRPQQDSNRVQTYSSRNHTEERMLDESRQLPKPPRDKTTGNAAITAMKEMVGMRHNDEE